MAGAGDPVTEGEKFETAPAIDDGRADASAATESANRGVVAQRDYTDRADFERAEKGFIGSLPKPVVHDSAGDVVWDMSAFDFLEGAAPATVHPGLWRHEQVNTQHGLFEVCEGVYQVRGFDLSNISFVSGETGWIVIDPLTCTETARAALDLLREHVDERPVTAVIYSHSHVDHFAGVLGVASQEEVDAGKIRVIAPDGFLEHAVSENVYVGVAMARRSAYQFGNLLPKDEKGYVGCGIGKSVSTGELGLIAPTDVITETGQELTVDGRRIVFQNTPDSEAPAEMHFYFPELKALCIAENCTATLHNLLTLRGAQVRNPLIWSKYLQEAIDLWGGEAESLFMSHNWPRWGADYIVDYVGKQRDMYRFIHDQTLRLANQGLTIDEIAEEIELPSELSQEFFCGGYYGAVNTGCKAVYQRYLGWFDGNPANLYRHPPESRARRYVDAMGGADAVLDDVRTAIEEGDYRWAAELGNHVVFAEPDNDQARQLQAAALEQLGYQSESGIWRAFYLTGAKELRHGIEMGAFRGVDAGAKIVAAVTMEMFLDSLATRLDAEAAAGKTLKVNIRLTDLDEHYTLIIDRSVLRYVIGREDPDADATLVLARTTLDAIAINPDVGFIEMMAEGKVEVEGDAEALAQMVTMIGDWTAGFPIVTP